MREQKIREAYGSYVTEHGEDIYDDYESFKAGYLALLTSLEPFGVTRGFEELFFLPEGVTIDE